MRHSAGTWSGKTSEVPCDPEFVIEAGYGFPTGPQAEAASHSGREFWDTVFRGLWAANYMRLS